MFACLRGVCKYRLIAYAAPLTFSLTLTNYNRKSNDDHVILQDDDDCKQDGINTDLEDETIVMDGNSMEYQLNEISGTFRSEFVSYIFQKWEQNQTISQIFTDLYHKYPTAITEFSLMIGGGIMSIFGFYYGRRKLKSRWFNRNFYNTINISLNTFDITKKGQIPKYLSSINFNVRTLCHSQIDELIPNTEGAKYLMQAATDQVKSSKISWIQRLFGADKDKSIDPILKLDHSSHFICYRLLRNAISKICAPHFIARDINNCLYNDINIERGNNSSLLSEKYLLSICVEEERWSKIHVVVIKKQNIQWLTENIINNNLNINDWGLLLNDSDQKEEWKRIRWNTIMCIAKEYQEQMNDFVEIELISPKCYNLFESKSFTKLNSS